MKRQPGATAASGTAYVANQPPDGYNVLVTTPNIYLAIEKDKDNFLIKEQFGKLHNLIQIFGTPRLSPGFTQTDLVEWLNQAEELAEVIAESGDSSCLANLYQNRANLSLAANDHESTIKALTRAFELYKEGDMKMQMAFTSLQFALHHISVYKATRNWPQLEAPLLLLTR